MTASDVVSGLRSLQGFLVLYGEAASSDDRAALDVAIRALSPPTDAEVGECSRRLWEATQVRSVKRDPQGAVRSVLERSREFHLASFPTPEQTP